MAREIDEKHPSDRPAAVTFSIIRKKGSIFALKREIVAYSFFFFKLLQRENVEKKRDIPSEHADRSFVRSTFACRLHFLGT